MKKVFLMLIAVATIAFVACTNQQENASTSASASASVEVTEFNADAFAANLDSLVAANDTAAVKGLLEQAGKEIEKLKAAGDQDALAALIAKVKTAVEGKADALKGLGLDQAAAAVAAVPEDLKDKVDAAAKDIVANAKDAAAEKVEEVKDAAAEKVNEVKDAAAEKVNEVKDAAKDQANKAIDGAKDKVNQAADDAKKKLGL